MSERGDDILTYNESGAWSKKTWEPLPWHIANRYTRSRRPPLLKKRIVPHPGLTPPVSLRQLEEVMHMAKNVLPYVKQTAATTVTASTPSSVHTASTAA